MTKKRYKHISLLITLIVLSSGLYGCQTKANAPVDAPESSAAPSAVLTPPQVISIDITPDTPPLFANSYDNANKYIKEVHPPDEELYNFIYAAADRMEETADISSFNLTWDEKFDTVECLSVEPRYELYNLQYAALTEDASHVQFVYYSFDKDTVENNKKALNAHLSHLLYNTAPENGTDIQKLFSVYSYILDHYEYSPDITDKTMASPYSILNNGYGICDGYAHLMALVLNKQGVTAEYACNDIHAWNIVKLDRQWYHTDVTFGVGSQASGDNLLSTVLMDDSTRHKSLVDNGAPDAMYIIGETHTNLRHAPACSDTCFSVYNDIDGNFAIDADSNIVFFCDDEGIKAMALDCTDERVLTYRTASHMAAFDGKLFYIDQADGGLYMLIPGVEPMLIDRGNSAYCYLKRQASALLYGENRNDCKALNLLFAPKQPANANNDVILSAEQTFETAITFSEPMNTEADWNDCVFLTDGDGNAYPLRFYWNEDGTQLFIRPMDDLYGIPSLTVTIADAPAANGAHLKKSSALAITRSDS